MTAQTPVYGLKYLTVGEAMRNTRQALQDNANTIEAALIGTGVHPPSAADLTGLAALQAALTANTAAITALQARQVSYVAAATVAAGTSLSAAGGELTALRLSATLDPSRVYEYEVTGIYNSGGTANFSARALAGSTAPTTSTGTVLVLRPSVVTSQIVPPLRARFTVNTAGTYTLSTFSGLAAQAGSASSGMPATATLSDAGPKVTGLPAVP